MVSSEDFDWWEANRADQAEAAEQEDDKVVTVDITRYGDGEPRELRFFARDNQKYREDFELVCPSCGSVLVE